MPRNLMSFLSELAVSPEKHARYLENPDDAMKQAGLDADECAALKSGDPAKVYRSLLGQSAPAAPVAQPSTHLLVAAAPWQAAATVCAPEPLAATVCVAQPPTVCIVPQAAIAGAGPPTVCIVLQAAIAGAGPPTVCIVPQAAIAGAGPPTVCIVPQAAIAGAGPPTVCIVPQAASVCVAQTHAYPINYYFFQPQPAPPASAPPEPASQPGSQSPQSETGTKSD